MASGNDASVENLKQQLSMIAQTLDEVQSALRVVEDRTDGAFTAVSHATEDSANSDVLVALVNLAKIKEAIEGQVNAAHEATEALTRYRDTR